MATFVKTGLRWFCLIYCALTLIDEIDARGGRGGGRFGGSRSYRSSYRSSSVRSYRAGRNWQWKAAAAAGAIYGYRSYSSRRRYYDSPDREPTICRNTVDYRMDNGTSYSMFICPMANQPEDHTYCCGPSNQQKCCRFWDDGGRVFGMVFGILMMIGIIGLIVYCCCCRNKNRGSKKPDNGAQYTMTHNQPPMSDMAPSYPQQPVGPDQKPPPYPPGPAGPYPPPGGDGQAPPFQMQPQGAPGYPPSGAYPPTSGPGYPPADGGPGYPPADGGPGYPPTDGGPGYPPSPYPPSSGPSGYPPSAPYPPGPAPPYPPGPAPGDGQQPAYPVNPSGQAPSAPPPPYPAN